MKKIISLLILLIALPNAVLAHHGPGPYDSTKILSVSGVITKVAFVNPHAYVYLDVTDEKGQVVNWNCELRASSVLKRSGWRKDMFKTGTKIDIVGIGSRRDEHGCYVETIAFDGGKPIARYAQLKKNQLVPEAEREATTKWGDPNIAGDWAATQRLLGAISGPNAASGPPGAPGGAAGRPGEGGGPRAGGGPPRPRGVELSEAGLAAQAAAGVENDTVTGRLDCAPRDFFTDWTFDQASNAIIQEKDTITLKYGFMDTVRTIHMNMSEHPADLEPSWAGHSIGKWEDDVLVVDTVGFTQSVTRRNTHSVQFKAVERFYLNEDNDTLTREYVGTDPLFFAEGEKREGKDVVYLSDYPWEPYACDDRTLE